MAKSHIFQSRRKFLKYTGVASVGGLAGCTGASEGDFPNKRIDHVVSYSPGGSYDTYARIFAPEASKILDQDVRIQNIPGGQGFAGAAQVVTGEADGYTYGSFGVPTHTNRILLEIPDTSLPWEDIIPFCIFSNTPSALVTDPNLEIESVDDLSDRYEDGDLEVVGDTALGGGTHLALELLKNEGVWSWDRIVDFGGSGAQLQESIISGETPAGFTGAPGATSSISEGVIDAIAVSGDEPYGGFPDVPTWDETGWPEVVGLNSARLLFLPPGTPEERVDVLEEAHIEAMKTETARSWEERTGNPFYIRGREEAQAMWDDGLNLDEDLLSVLEQGQ